MKVYRIHEKIAKYRFGNPFPTDGVLVKGDPWEKEGMDYFQVEQGTEIRLTYKMDSKDVVWGLGENQRGMNKRGGIYVSYCSDDPRHTPDKKSLYGAHNFMIVDGREQFGLFIDYPGQVAFDIGFSHKDAIEIIIDGTDADIYIIDGEGLREIVRKFFHIIGEGYAPPKWAFGYQQSRWSYPDAKTIERVAEAFIDHDIPCDALYLDIDYMEGFKDFTVSEDRFPDFPRFVEKMREKGFRLVPIIDAGVKIEKDYGVYEEGIQGGYFCTDGEGKPFVAAVWPGKVHFPDFLNPEARRWFGLKYKGLIDWGIEGFWNDMNEPAIFYTERGLRQGIELAKQSENENLDMDSFFALKDAFIHMSNHREDYQSMYHHVDGKQVNHHEVHNLYGCYMTRAAAEGFEEIAPNKRFLLFSRASYIGMHRFGGIWTGDNHSWWEHILLNLKMMPSLNMCGFLYAGADTGGFGGDANAQLLIRWTQFSLFTPLFRNHSAMGGRRQEPFSFDQETTEMVRKAIQFRYALIPYIYSEYMKALLHRDMYMLPLAFAYEDEMSRRVENQLLVGDGLMIAPIYEENALGRYVWLPEDMLLWKVDDYRKRSYEIKRKGHLYLEVELHEIPVFIRKNKMLIFGNHGRNTEVMDHRELYVVAFIEDRAQYVYYDDDGLTKDYKQGKYAEIMISIERREEDFEIKIENRGNRQVERIHFEMVDTHGNIAKKTVVLAAQ